MTEVGVGDVHRLATSESCDACRISWDTMSAAGSSADQTDSKQEFKKNEDSNVMEDDSGSDEGSATRRGRFRVSAPPAGPPETTVGRFRLVPQGGNYGPASPFLQRGRFSVIPEEPQNSPSATITPPIITTDRQASPDWDFDDDKIEGPQRCDGTWQRNCKPLFNKLIRCIQIRLTLLTTCNMTGNSADLFRESSLVP
ncbi:conserved hypothetical protein [Culex quinquefasciatus]|uniref:Uncharacterized protein n=1 Tax=Culex quinquefasciatus TaxID=7176 RepID=B0WG23_CULQU|nr:conserved hypothetical protein [Culex quinquefasciatus]|eukprot:XP_001847657.1 conserved hypothetical protein [Culex quinquefasciatus]